MNKDDHLRKIADFVGQYLGVDDIDPHHDLFESGLANSLFAMQLVLFVEKEFGITVSDEDLDVDNFKSLNAISAFVGKKTNSPG